MQKFKIYRSSAGSGKTFTLTKEYLKLLFVAPAYGGVFKPNYFRHVLAVTFTNDAANEMKIRILESIAQIAKNPKNSQLTPILLQEIAQEYPAQKVDEYILQQRSQQIHEQLLHEYSDFAVSTIDAFSNRVVRAFTKDLDLPYNYEIELDTDTLLSEASEALLALAGNAEYKELSEILREFAEKRAEDSKDWNLETALKNFGKNLFEEENKALLESLQELSFADLRQIKNKLFAYKNSIKNKLQGVAQKALRTIDQNGFNEKTFFYGKSGVYGYFKKIVDEFDKFEFDGQMNSYVRKGMDENKWAGSDKKMKDTVDNFGANVLRKYVQEIEQIREDEKNNYIIVDNLLPNAYLIVLLAEFGRQLHQIMRQKSQVHLSEFNKKINEIVEKEPVPYIYERLGERFHHILIDEFQDTSRMQWHNLIPLLSNALGSNYMNLIVGDAKQAIYRWRGGDSELIVSLPKVPSVNADSPLAKDLDTFRIHANPQNLQTNWRSKADIIGFNNHFFEFISQNFGKDFDDLVAYYREVRQESNKRTGGHIELRLLEKTNYHNQTFEEILEISKKLLTKNYAYQDIAILCRRNVDASFLAKKFLEHKIPVISSESLLLEFSPKVMFIVNFLQVMTQVLNPSLKFELIYFIFKHLNQDLAREDLIITDQVYDQIQEVCNDYRLSKFLNFIKQKTGIRLSFKTLQYLSIYEIAEELIRIFGLNANNNEQIYLQKLLDVLLDFGLKQSNNLADFVDFWQKNSSKLSVSSPEGTQAIRIMSIHKSKGLQFPVVILPFADWQLKPQNTASIWVDWSENTIVPQLQSIILTVKDALEATQFRPQYLKEMQATFIEGINLLYVALTRAEEQLYVLGKKPDKKKTENTEKIPKSVNELWFLYAQATQEHLEEGENETQTVVFAQDEAHFERKPKKQAQHYFLKNFISSECRDKIRMRSDDMQTENRRITIAELHEARMAGTVMHTAFEKIRYREDVEAAVRFLINKGIIKEEEKEEMMQKIFYLIDLPLINPFFQRKADRKVRNETEIMTNNGRIFRPDRLVIDNDQVLILDYKTGTKKAEHLAQINHYAYLLKEMGYQKVRKILLYTELSQAVEV